MSKWVTWPVFDSLPWPIHVRRTTIAPKRFFGHQCPIPIEIDTAQTGQPGTSMRKNK